MNEHQIKCFLAVRKHLNFTSAADQLYITQPALTYQIHSLEQELGVRLFDRTTTSVTLTEAGLAFAIQAEKLHQLYLETVNVMRSFSSINQQIVLACPRIMITHDKIYYILMSRIIETFPQYDVEVLASKIGMETFDNLSSRIDCYIGMKPALEEDGVRYDPLFQPQFYIIADPKHPLSNRKIIAPAELAGHTLYYESEERRFAGIFRRVLERNNIPVSFKKVPSFDTVYPNFIEGKGLFISPVVHGGFPPHVYVRIQTDEILPMTVLISLKEPANPCVPKLRELILQVYQEFVPEIPSGSQT